jgi:hypothetical protein
MPFVDDLASVLRGDNQSPNGNILVTAGHVVPPSLIVRLVNYACMTEIKEPISIEDPHPGRSERSRNL